MEDIGPVAITLQINTAQDIQVLDGDNKAFDEVDPAEIRNLYQRGEGVRHIGEMLYDAQGCFTYIHINCRWIKVPVPC